MCLRLQRTKSLLLRSLSILEGGDQPIETIQFDLIRLAVAAIAGEEPSNPI